MSTRSLIAKQIGEDEYLTIYCHSDGYLTYNGAMLLDHYNTPEKVDALLELGDISSLGKRLEPEQGEKHSFESPIDDVTIAYSRDRGDKNTEAEKYSLKDLDNPNGWHAYVYIFTDKNEWKFFRHGGLEKGLRDVKEDLDKIYAGYGMERPKDYYGFVTEEIIDELKNESNIEPDESGPVQSM